MNAWLSNDFNTKIIDPDVEQNLLVIFPDCYLSAKEGDFIAGQAMEIVDTYNSETDAGVGEVNARRLSMTLNNRGGILSDLEYGKARVFIGIDEGVLETNTYPDQYVANQYVWIRVQVPGDTNVKMVRYSKVSGLLELHNGSTWLGTLWEGDPAKKTSLYAVTKKVGSDSNLTSSTLYFVQEDTTVVFDLLDNGLPTGTTRTTPQRMQEKAGEEVYKTFTIYGDPDNQNNITAYSRDRVFDIRFNGTETISGWEYAPMGEFNVKKPEYIQGNQIEIRDAYDDANLFTEDATQLLEALSYPVSVSSILQQACDIVGVPVDTSFPGSTDMLPRNYFTNAMTIREIVGKIAERAMCNARIGRGGILSLDQQWGPHPEDVTEVVDDIPATRIAMNGYQEKYLTVEETNTILNKNLNGETSMHQKTSGDYLSTYTILGNPFWMDLTDTTRAETLRTLLPFGYHPGSVSVLEAHPGIDAGDWIAYTKPDGETTYLPIFTQTISWNGITSAEYECDGNERRDPDDKEANTDYKAALGINAAETKVSQYFGTQYSGQFLVIDSNGYVGTRTLEQWSGGNY